MRRIGSTSPASPAGLIELTDADLDIVTGASYRRNRYGCNL
ncbi:MAG TPA: mersacidin/lichenicidin family type 2 lantibiotic [Anaerolineae bacterium]|nr:mersacidin/lichenicidin family type 2 lantibiotic [Anaerolineae bacterium]